MRGSFLVKTTSSTSVVLIYLYTSFLAHFLFYTSYPMSFQNLRPACLSEDPKQNKTAQINLMESSRTQQICIAKRQFSANQTFGNTQRTEHQLSN